MRKKDDRLGCHRIFSFYGNSENGNNGSYYYIYTILVYKNIYCTK
ncbi:hypothetical protein PspKH34_06140 [Parageobacillus sp. KH3-4]|nr:hypothetical protein PspKH34_06140 [Parageobacillus sp. KH3-4]